MTNQEHYNTIEQTGIAEFKDKGSRFIAHAFPIANTDVFKTKLNELKKEHPKAVHHCYAYRLGFDKNTFRVNDDGEPGGSAGKPILGQIDSKQLTNTAIIIVRYFGGTLLGIPGLINAYKTASALALQVIPIVQKPILANYNLSFDYTLMNEIMMIIKQCNCEVLQQEMNLFCQMQIGIPKARLQEVVYKLNEIRNIEVSAIK